MDEFKIKPDGFVSGLTLMERSKNTGEAISIDEAGCTVIRFKSQHGSHSQIFPAGQPRVSKVALPVILGFSIGLWVIIASVVLEILGLPNLLTILS